MDPERADRTDLLEQIITEGDRRKQRRRRVAGAGAALVVVALLTGVALAGGGAGGDQQVAVGDDPTSTTAAEATTSSTSSTTTSTAAPIEVTTSTLAPASGGGEDPPPPEATTLPPPVCRNSYDSRCGGFYWDYDPATFPNAPLSITIDGPAAPPVAGQPFLVTLTYDDPDSRADPGCEYFGLGGIGTARSADGFAFVHDGPGFAWPCASIRCPDSVEGPRYGPWDPPAPESNEPTVVTLEITYRDAGTYELVTTGRASVSCWSYNSLDRSRFDGYASEATATFTIEVLPA